MALDNARRTQDFFGQDNKMELRSGGPFEIYFLMDQDTEERGSEECRVLSYLPERMLSFSWSAPPDQPFVRHNNYKTFVVLEFEALATCRTKACLTHAGWPEGKQWDIAFDYFARAWPMVLQWLTDAAGKADY